MGWPTVKKINSSNENVFKYVFENKNAVAEAVLYKYPTFEERTVICCSTQSGCPVGCRFCGAGDYFVRSLDAKEITDQVDYLIQSNKIDPEKVNRMQIMFMSMGEPMLNWKQLEKALKCLHSDYPKARLLISTSGPDVDYGPLVQLASEINTIGLQFSAHESTDEERNKLVPFKAKLSLEDMGGIGKMFFLSTGRKPFFNYCVHEKNNTQEDVNRLVELFPPHYFESTISVICERDEHIAAANERQRSLCTEFMAKMLNAGYSTRMFDPAGQDDIGGGCGQLWFVQDWMKKNPELARPSCGNDLPKVHTPKNEPLWF